jgi:UPF0716 protein FxsA
MKLRYIILSLLFLPFFEFGFFGFVSDRLGVLPSLALVVITSCLGMMMLKEEGRRLVKALKTDMSLTGESAKKGLMIAFAGLLFAFPGFLSDILGVLCLILSSRYSVPIDAFRPKPQPQDNLIDLEAHEWREINPPQPKPRSRKKSIES